MATQRLKKGQLPQMAANSVRVRNANSVGDGSDLVLTNAQLMIGDGTGFTAAALSGDVSMDNAGAVTIAATAVERSMIADDAIDSTKLANDAVNSEHIADGAIDLVHLSANSVDSDQYVDGSIDLVHMSANSVDSDQYVDGSIDTVHIAASQITNALMADDAIDSAEIADGAIDLAHMSANSVDSDQYVDGSVDNVHMANHSLTLGSREIDLGATDTEIAGLTSLDFAAGNRTLFGSQAAGNNLTIGNNAGGNVIIKGNLQVDGLTTTINSTTVQVDDKNVQLGDGTANHATMTGAGLTVATSDAGNKTLNYVTDATPWVSSENFVHADTKEFGINGTEVLSANGAVKVQSGVAGLGLVHEAGALNLNPDDSSLELNGDVLRIKGLGVVNGMLAADAVTEAKIADNAVQKEHFHSDCFGPGLKADDDNSIKLNLVRNSYPGSAAATDQDLVDSSSNAVQTKAFGQLPASAFLAAGPGGGGATADQPDPGCFLQVFLNGIFQDIEITSTASNKGNDRLAAGLADCLLDVTGRRIQFLQDDISDSDSINIIWMND